MALLVGTLLLLLTIGMVLKYGPTDMPQLADTVALVHGLSYMVYLAVAYDLWRRTGWPLGRMAVIVLGGAVPLMTFFVERWIVREARALAGAKTDVKAGANA